MKMECDWNEVDLRDNRYHLVVHLVSAANGAEAFYTTQGHATRHEGIEFAKTLDKITSQVCICSVLNTSSPRTTCVCVFTCDRIKSQIVIVCCLQAWVGHPYFHLIDNSTDFERRLMRMISVGCLIIGILIYFVSSCTLSSIENILL